MTDPIPLSKWQSENTPTMLPRHIRRNIKEGPGGCWIWTRSCSPDGYGWASLNNKTYQAHRLVYRLTVGAIPEGLVLDHLCRVRNCVNPDHLEPVTPRENLARGNTPTGWSRCQRCNSEFIKLRNQRRCPKCLEAYEAARKPIKRIQQRARRAAA